MRSHSRALLPASLLIAVGLVLSGCSSSAKPPKKPSTSAGASNISVATTITAAMRPSASQASKCATAHPTTWMGCLVAAHSKFASAPLSGLAIPGSNDAGAFSLDPEGYDNSAGSKCSVPAGQLTTQNGLLQPWSETQDQTITQQLDDGVRWLDLQVGFNGTSAVQGWRVVQNLYSDYPLSYYLAQVASWAAFHPTEAVFLDVRLICSDHDPTKADYAGLWANFAAVSAPAATKSTIRDVAFNASVLGSHSLATATLGDIIGTGKTAHNVVVLVPGNASQVSVLTSQFHIHPVRTDPSGTGASGPGSVTLVDAAPSVIPTAASGFAAANHSLEASPLSASPAMGSLVGSGFYEARLLYDLPAANAAQQKTLFSTFGGLINGSTPTGSAPLSAWESGLWSGSYDRNSILAAWGHRANVVVTDGVEQAGFAAQVIRLNAK